MINIKKKIKLLIFVLCLGFLSYIIFNNLEILNILKQNKTKFFFLIFIGMVYINFIILRAFLFLRVITGYSYSFFDWAKLYSESILLNFILPLSGFAYKGIELKKRSVGYTQYIVISYFLIGAYFALTLISVLLETLFIQKIFSVFILTLMISLIFLIFASPIAMKILSRYMKKLKQFKKYTKSINYLLEILKNTYENKNLLFILFINTIIIHIIELSFFYIICNIFLENVNLQVIIALFAASFIIDRIPFISEIPGVSEIILGTLFLPLGFYFVDGVFIKLTSRVINYISVMFNSVGYFILSFYDKNKFIN